jgi:hypothetical protein
VTSQIRLHDNWIHYVSDASQPRALLANIRSTIIQGLQFVYLPNFFLNIPIPCYIFVKHMSLFVFCCEGRSSMFSRVFVVIYRCFDKSMIGINYTQNNLLTLSLFVSAIACLTWSHIDKDKHTTLFYDLHNMIKLKLMLIYGTDFVTSRLFRKSFNCRYYPGMEYAFCLLKLKSSKKWPSLLFGATFSFNN